MSDIYPYKIDSFGPFTRFRYSDIKATKVDSPPGTMNAEVLEEDGEVKIEFPVRTHYLNNRKPARQLNKEAYTNIYTPFESDKIDFSCFVSTPHVLQTQLQTFLTFKEDTTIPVEVHTRGAATFWVNGEWQGNCEHFMNNNESATIVELVFKKGTNELVILMEDLAERDCNYYLEIKNLSTESITGFFPVENKVEYASIEEFLYGLYMSQDQYLRGPIELKSSQTSRNKDYKLCIEINPSKTLKREDKLKIQDGNITEFRYENKTMLFKKDSNTLVLDYVEDFDSAGLTVMRISLKVKNGKRIFRDIVFSVYNEMKFSSMLKQSSAAARKKEAIDYFSKLDNEDINTAIAKMALNQHHSIDIFETYASALDLIKVKGDCADFILAPMLAALAKFHDRMDQSHQSRFEELVLNFRYWFDEPGNDAMWFFSENHALLFHVSQYLAGFQYPNKEFKVSGRSGMEQYQTGKKRLIDWFDKFFEFGFSEWNSITYIPIDLIGFFSLYLGAPDKQIQNLAKQALDYTFKILAVNYHGGVIASSYGRVYEHNLKAIQLGELSNVTKIAWGKGYFNNALRASALFALSDYEPPKIYESFLEPEEALLHQQKQGKNQIHTYQYKTKAYSLASAIDYRPGKLGHQQHVLNISLGDSVLLWINNPGEKVYSGNGRPSFWAGTGILPYVKQYKNTAFMKYDLTKAKEQSIHVYLPFWQLDDIVQNEWLTLRHNDSYLGIYFSQGYEIERDSAIKDRAATSKGARHHVIVKCSSKQESGSFNQFSEQLKRSKVTVDGEVLLFEDREHGLFKHSEALFVNNRPYGDKRCF